MNDDDLWNLVLGNNPGGPSAIPFANGLGGDGGAGPPPYNGSSANLGPWNPGDLAFDPSAWDSMGLSGSAIASVLPQRQDTSAAFPPSPGSGSPINLTAWNDTGLGDGTLPILLPQKNDASAPSLPAATDAVFSSPPASSPPPPTSGPNDPGQPNQNSGSQKATSDAGRQFIQNWEGYKDQVYSDVADNPTFGYGHKLTDADQNLTGNLAGMTDDQKRSRADSMFDADVKSHEQALYRQLGPDAVGALTQNQFDALVAASYNGGVGPRMIGDVQKGDNDAAAGEFNADYITKNVNGVPTKVFMPSLRDRNAAERNMFVNSDYSGRPR